MNSEDHISIKIFLKKKNHERVDFWYRPVQKPHVLATCIHFSPIKLKLILQC